MSTINIVEQTGLTKKDAKCILNILLLYIFILYSPLIMDNPGQFPVAFVFLKDQAEAAQPGHLVDQGAQARPEKQKADFKYHGIHG